MGATCLPGYQKHVVKPHSKSQTATMFIKVFLRLSAVLAVKFDSVIERQFHLQEYHNIEQFDFNSQSLPGISISKEQSLG